MVPATPERYLVGTIRPCGCRGDPVVGKENCHEGRWDGRILHAHRAYEGEVASDSSAECSWNSYQVEGDFSSCIIPKLVCDASNY